MSLFSTAVQTILTNWTALQLAVEHQMGGTKSKEIANWMVTVIENFFKENDNVIPQEVGDYIGEIMNTEFDTLCEDGSLDEIGENLCKFYELIKTGNEEQVKLELQKYKGSAVHLCQSAPTSNIDEVDDVDNSKSHSPDQSDASKKSSKNEPDEDGWITVSKGKKH